jgi:hypothetical protein
MTWMKIKKRSECCNLISFSAHGHLNNGHISVKGACATLAVIQNFDKPPNQIQLAPNSHNQSLIAPFGGEHRFSSAHKFDF